MTKRDEFRSEIRRLKIARQNTTSKALKTDYSKAIKRKEKELKIYDYYQRRKIS